MIGIISYLPEEEVAHGTRYWRMRSLLKNLKILFPKEHIVIIAQNYTDEDVEKISEEVDIRRYDRLGVLGARNTLRDIFLDSNEEYLILYDDDSELVWLDPNAGEQFINHLKTNKYGYIGDKTHSCKNIGVRRSVVEALKWRNTKNTCDDSCFWCDLLKLYGFENNWDELVNDGLRGFILDVSTNNGDKFRTWTADDLGVES